MQKTYTTEEIVEMLKKRAAKITQRRLADELSISQTFLSDIIQGKAPLSPKVAENFGFNREIIFKKAS